MQNIITKMKKKADALFFPRLCYCCKKAKATPNYSTCLSCRTHLPETNFHQYEQNTFIERFLGRLPARQKLYGTACYAYRKGNGTQKLIYELKYNGKYDVGIEVGRNYGQQLQQSPFYQDVDLIVPVPLHPKKRAQRGYNQSDAFAIGLSETMNKPWIQDGLIRTAHTTSQTNKTRLNRLANVQQIFHVNQSKLLKGKHILLVDDVLTTGATLESCATKLLNLSGTKVSMATIAIAMN